ncbi:MAG: HNH endonuclease domain-containing protein [Chitinophagales bacterium]|nr:HNH endonuclease domain-containing protein [Chitinophagales bacterium]
MDIKTCPYCNAQYTLFAHSKTGKHRTLFEFDHFFPKSRYPYLSVSLFNLIPSCASCNRGKSSLPTTIQANYHPYVSSFHKLAEFKLMYPSTIDKQSFAQLLKMNYDKDLELHIIKRQTLSPDEEAMASNHIRDFHLEAIYDRHKDIAYRILLLARMNDKHYQEAISGIEGLFNDRATVLRYMLGNELSEIEINKRPLNKLTVDLARQLGLIT